jgi:hypothetical protein
MPVQRYRAEYHAERGAGGGPEIGVRSARADKRDTAERTQDNNKKGRGAPRGQ